MDKVVANIYETRDYQKFAIMEENREITKQRKKKVEKSFNEIGVLFGEPVVVNENFEVADGQARLKVLEERGEPVYYVVQPGIGKKEIAILNSASTNWSMMDYVESYSKQGLDSYIYLSELIKRFGNNIPFSVIVSVTQDNMCATGNAAGREIKAGTFRISEGDKVEIASTLEFLVGVKDYVKRIEGSTTFMLLAIAWIYRHTKAEHERLVIAIKNCSVDKDGRKNGVSTIRQALSLLEDAYNCRKRGNRIYFLSEYKEYNSKMTPGYDERWAKK